MTSGQTKNSWTGYPKEHNHKHLIDKFDFMNIKVFCTSKDTIKKMNRWAIVKKNYSQLINLTKDSYLDCN